MLANVVCGLVILVCFLAMTVFIARSAWLIWRHPERAPTIKLTKSNDPSVIRGHARAVLPFVGFLLSLTLMFLAMLVSSVLTGTPQEIAMAVGGLMVPGIVLSMAAHAGVAWFNRPKFLAPPHLRGDDGSVTEWWRHRKALRQALEEVQSPRS